LIRKAALAETGDPGASRPNEARIRQNFATLVNADPSEIVLVPATQTGESYVVAALGISPERGDHVVSDYLHFVGSQEMYTDMAKRGLDVTWVKTRDKWLMSAGTAFLYVRTSSPGRAASVKVTTRWNHLRISPSVFNDMDDVEHLLAVLPRA